MQEQEIQPQAAPLAETPQIIIGPDMKPLELTRSVKRTILLAVERFNHPNKHYRLIWARGREAWLCEEDKKSYTGVSTPGGVIEAGRKLALELGVQFSEIVR